MYDIIIVGAGVSGCAIARELSRYELNIAVLERSADVCEGTSKANSGIVHAGYDAKPGTLKARLNVEGSSRMPALAKELDFPYTQNGALVLCFDQGHLKQLEELKQRGEQNGVEGICILNKAQVRELEPAIGEQVEAALYAPTGAIVCPFGLTIALAENAAANEVDFVFNAKVESIDRGDNGFVVKTTEQTYESRMVINAAGVYADEIHNMVCKKKLEIIPRRGEYLLCDKKVGGLVRHTLFQLPTALGKGVLVTPTVHGNLLMGPTAEDIADKEGIETTAQGMALVQQKAAMSIANLPTRQVITSFAGLRARTKGGDFIIQESSDTPGFIDVAGMESPGLSCAPAVGVYVADMVAELLHPVLKKKFADTRKGIPSMALASDEERQKLIAENPAYGNVICRCEMVTEGEILESIHRPLGATTVDGVKRRTRAGMGRCQSGFCNPRVVEILSRELHVDESEITKAGEGSYYILPSEEQSGEEEL